KGMEGSKLRIYSDRGIVFAAGLFFVLSVADAALTLWGLNLRVIEEANPLMRVLIDNRPWLFVALKTLVPVVLGIYCWYNRDRDRGLVSTALVLSNGIYLVVSMFHLFWIILYNIS
ncbi:MAG TPA: DUF5658 family protein, partial [Verrucomicrobiae bacterium]|nr:DUF5658 family protein [Verrucomicrobiae bacterium]